VSERDPAEGPAEPAAADEPSAEQLVDVLADELMLARAQIDAGQPGLAEGTARRRLARLEADGAEGAADEMDAMRVLLAEALWRQQRPVAARAALDQVRPGSAQRRLPIAILVEAEALAAAGESDRAAGAQERLLAAVGIDEAARLVGGVPGRLTWPLAGELQTEPTRAARPPWGTLSADASDEDPAAPDDERQAAARARLEEARVAYVAGMLEEGDAQMSISLRLDASLASDGVRILEPTLGRQPAVERLLLYGDLLRAAGREAEADRAYDRAADRPG
jgi:hypothetical protein